MDQGVVGSFIPKRVLTTERLRQRRPVNLLWLTALLILFLSVILFAGAYAFKQVLANEIERPCQEITVGSNIGSRRCGLRASVELEEKNLDRAAILLLQRLDHKLKAAQEVIDRHVNILPIFRLLEELTLSRVRYTSFRYSGNNLSLDGVASSYEDIAVQSQIFAVHRDRIQNFIFSDLNLNDREQVVFKLTMVLEPGLTAYVKSLKP